MKIITQKKNDTNYWKKFVGIEKYKLEWYFKYFLYKIFKIKLPKLADQRKYWQDRGQVYFDEITSSGYLEREVFFQNMLVDELNKLEFNSFFEAGCGFGWNIYRVKNEFPNKFVSGVDFSLSQLSNSKRYSNDIILPVINGDATKLPLKNNAFDVGFSLGVFMNINPRKIKFALEEMMRVCRKYIIHIEYDENHTTEKLKEKRTFKTNIVSHNYTKLYKEMGAEILSFKSYIDFEKDYENHNKNINSDLERWEGFEGPEKYIFIIIRNKQK